MDFVDEYPKFCIIRTSLAASQIDPQWLEGVLLIVIGSHLGMKDLKDVKILLAKWRNNGFKAITTADIPKAEVASDKDDNMNLPNLRLADKRYRHAALTMNDPYGRTGLMRFCFFFLEEEDAKTPEVPMMECPPFPGRVYCSDNECPCDNTTMPPAEGYLWIKSEVATCRKNCLSLKELSGQMKATGTSLIDTNAIRGYFPIVVCQEAAKRRNLNLDVAKADFRAWVKTGSVPCRPTPLDTAKITSNEKK